MSRIYCEKGENAGYQHFLLFQQCAHKHFLVGLQKSGLCSKEVGIQEIAFLITKMDGFNIILQVFFFQYYFRTDQDQ